MSNQVTSAQFLQFIREWSPGIKDWVLTKIQKGHLQTGPIFEFLKREQKLSDSKCRSHLLVEVPAVATFEESQKNLSDLLENLAAYVKAWPDLSIRIQIEDLRDSDGNPIDNVRRNKFMVLVESLPAKKTEPGERPEHYVSRFDDPELPKK